MTRVCIDIDNDGPGPTPAVRTYSTTVGDGASLEYMVDHNLGSRDVFATVYDLNSGMVLDAGDVFLVNANRLALRFGSAPAAQSVRVTLLAVRPGE